MERPITQSDWMKLSATYRAYRVYGYDIGCTAHLNDQTHMIRLYGTPYGAFWEVLTGTFPKYTEIGGIYFLDNAVGRSEFCPEIGNITMHYPSEDFPRIHYLLQSEDPVYLIWIVNYAVLSTVMFSPPKHPEPVGEGPRDLSTAPLGQ